ncbi:2-aminoethylphosphonate aminotransferase [uncultured Selenomonas sp.]|uniref:2-aminoethylphosphonate aminotransferase n=1 Tax=uncultured Selenomonas sp. TaxID=159275 RepID=UPI0028D259B9|nr:2-aminoethylphosphonate aminotransferase [uncultured Selenomonas sp.]
MNIQRNILLNPGPATTTDTVKAAQLVPDICPREQDFGRLMRDLGMDLLKVVHADEADWAAVLFCGSGTICMDACVSSLVPADGKLLIVNNGAYSARAAAMARAYSVPHIDLQFPINELPDLDVVAQTLAAHPDITAVYTTHQETGTGILNPVREIGALAHAHGAVMIADTISTYAMIPFAVEDMNIDVCMSSAQKGIQGMTGLSFVIARKSVLAAAKSYPVRSYYTNLVMQHAGFEETGEMRFTPPVQTVYAAQQALAEYFAEGAAAKWARHTRTIDAIHAGLARLGLTETIPRAIQSGLVVAVDYPADFDFARVHDYCYARGYTIYPGKMQTASTFRLCALGAIDAADIEGFFRVFEDALRA